MGGDGKDGGGARAGASPGTGSGEGASRSGAGGGRVSSVASWVLDEANSVGEGGYVDGGDFSEGGEEDGDRGGWGQRMIR